MRRLLIGLLVIGFVFQSGVGADEDSNDAVKKERKRLEGTWQVTSLVVGGNKSKKEDVQKLTVVNGDDGTRSVLSEGKVVSKGTSTLAPMAEPKTIDFTATEGGGSGDRFVGIYQLGKKKRKLCFVRADQERPTEFTSTAENKYILVAYKRVE
ncbi:hypothetical protein Mal15_36450 [Stieleria maiorica]|uniref:TIGR03067 domain-containing protein n=1 Tax=Stieleria maiorica TaxID=2795974 RepID=A0A5B9MGF3_9BACT|nr:TIGR03067 domain-containing protein [Stieleria maiorica]QEF99579.1 hypothetical protein Mal15_36450 [Stieleria maiorica]